MKKLTTEQIDAFAIKVCYFLLFVGMAGIAVLMYCIWAKLIPIYG